MAIADWFRKQPRKRKRVEIALEPLEAVLTSAVPRLEGVTVEPDLVRARLADAYRDADIDPLPPAAFDARADGLDTEAWRRLDLAVRGLDYGPLRNAIPVLVADCGVARQVEDAFVGLARETPLLTMELLRQSPLRIEEFVRKFLARLGAAVAGETAPQSRECLERLDYARLLAEADRAKVSAEDRMEYLRKLQEKRDQSRPSRGKW